jgi:hypothetical protein
MKEKKFSKLLDELCLLLEMKEFNQEFSVEQKAEIKSHINLWLK